MSSPTVATASALPTLRFRLPGRWSSVPLHDRAEASAALRALIREHVGVADDRAAIRAELRSRFLVALDAAIDGAGQSMLVATQIVPEVPVPVTITVFLPEQGMTPAIGDSPAGVIDVLVRGLEQRDLTEAATLHRFVVGPSHVARVHRRILADPPADHDGDVPALMVDYWLSIPGTKRVALASFSTAIVELDDVMLAFFDSIVAASYWSPPDAP